MSSPNDAPISGFVFEVKKSIPKRQLGDEVEKMMRLGYEPYGLHAIFQNVRPATDEEAKEALALPDLRRKSKKRRAGPTQQEVVLKMLASGPRTFKEFAAAFAKRGWGRNSSGSVLFQMMQKGFIKRTAPATYAKV